MNKGSSHRSLSLLVDTSNGLRLPSLWSALRNCAAAVALLALSLPMVVFVGIGMSAFALELTRAMALAGPIGMVGIALMAATGMAVRRGVAIRSRAAHG